MSIKPKKDFARPNEAKGEPLKLMDLQDIEHKGDGITPERGEQEPMVLCAFKLPASLKQELKLKSAQTGRTMASMVEEGIRKVLSE